MTGSLTLSDAEAEAVVRLIEAAPQVQRRHHFFVWTQAYLQPLLPHQIAICGAYQRVHKELVFEALNSVAIDTGALELLTDVRSPVMRQLVDQWTAQRGRALIVSLTQLVDAGTTAARELLLRCGVDEILVHGVARPERPTEVESLFLLMTPEQPVARRRLALAELLMPHLQATYMRVRAVEREIGEPQVTPALARAGARSETLTGREREILSQVRDGKSNQQIGEALEISALTVKNHVQNILRKLGASNRAQAVALAMSLNLMSAFDPSVDPAGRSGRRRRPARRG